MFGFFFSFVVRGVEREFAGFRVGRGFGFRVVGEGFEVMIF